MSEFRRYDPNGPVVTEATLRLTDSAVFYFAGQIPYSLKIALDSATASGDAVTVRTSPNDLKQALWQVRVQPVKTGKSEVTVNASSTSKGSATLKITVTEKVALPTDSGEETALVKLLLAESRAPSDKAYVEADSLKGMRWMKRVLKNRLDNHPEQYAARGAKTLIDIMRGNDAGKEQFKGFPSYPTLSSGVQTTLDDFVMSANQNNNKLSDAYVKFIDNAKMVAKEPPIVDPSPKGLYGWRTQDKGSPGSNFEAYLAPLSGNQFFTLK